ncbi:hypothetical protein GGTG_01766 [Gaeumannomyces tritici R3-111a-1]|uniref:HEAT repeat protein n=1 Tax=Gaeumannomyces tritici (strain R3-111a-1) TaxID=644352 RepID=J3NKH4_GAET3|nr:hypothetical protein GGTG_01766 [Gaeumannomyces tritici R3-111a-1]EJT81791.1 hypothetical protein GGTG_01766 [Gaeumannomyces tritici R3-111a-1]
MEPSALFRNASTSRNELFAKLKPCCVAISKVVLRPPDQLVAAGSSAHLLQLTDQLCGILSDQIKHNAAALDPKMAEYVFFPLSYIFKEKDKYAARVLENCIRCLGMLVQHGWRSAVSTEMAQQLLMLLTFLIAGVPGKDKGPPPPEETALESYRTLAILIRTACLSPLVSESLVDAAGPPSLAHAVTVILEGVTDGTTVDIQLAALDALGALFITMKDRAALASFLPGTVSALSKLLSPPSSMKTQRRILIRGLDVLRGVLTKLLGDIHNRDALRQLEGLRSAKAKEEDAQVKEEPPRLLSASWLKASVSQIKVALALVLKLRSHGAEDVRGAIEKLCLSLLDECHTSLADCAVFLVESAIITWKDDPEPQGPRFDRLQLDLSGVSQNSVLPATLEINTTLQDLAMIYPELQDTTKAVVYNWVTSLPRVMQASEESLKQQSIRSLSKGYRLAKAMQIDSSTLHAGLSSALRDSVVALTAAPSQKDSMSEVDTAEDDTTGLMALAKQDTQAPTFKPAILSHGSQKTTREALLELVANIGPPSQQAQLASGMLDCARDSEGIDQIAQYWLSFELSKAALSNCSELDAFIDFSAADTADGPEEIFNELYSFSVSVLVSHSDSNEVDWRLEATALEVTSFAASRSGESFRPELIDVLYPTATFLGSQVPQLRARAVATLNGLASSCGYQSVSELIIDNADYMVNSVSLRLNTFDITPASTQVLRMMIQLTGPRLIPFLDDVVASIFAALDNYHGYPAFVERLFSVLSEVVNQGVKSDVLLLESNKAGTVDHRKRSRQTITVNEIESDILERREQKRRRRLEEENDDVEEIATGHPKEPWKSEAAELLKKKQEELDGTGADGESDSGQEVEKAKPPPTPTYALLTKVANLTQHYLTSPSPTLRKSLLDLLTTASTAMAADEDSFLPLVNSLWPVLITRLRDAEPYVVAAACRAIAAVAGGAGDFLASRVKTEWWGNLGPWCRRAKAEAQASARGTGRSGGKSHGASKAGVSYLNLATTTDIVLPHHRSGSSSAIESRKPAVSGGLGRFAQAALVWEAAVELLAALALHVRLEDDVFDQLLELLGDELEKKGQVREALEAVNADAVWLALYERGAAVPEFSLPAMDGVAFARVDPVLQAVGSKA